VASYSDAQLQSLKDALASGELDVTFQGRRTTYRSIDELITAISIVERELAAASGSKPVRVVKTFMDDETGIGSDTSLNDIFS
jgi:hypothetical protein